jgi:hypothetical protein
MAETLEKIYLLFKAAEELEIYKKANSTLKVPDIEEYDNLSEDIKIKYKKYDDYVIEIKNQININKSSIRNKLDELKSVVLLSNNLNDDEKIQYQNEIDNIKENIIDVPDKIKIVGK